MKLNPLEQLSRRTWLVDRQLAWIGQEMRDGLGDWMTHRLERGVRKQGQEARNILEDCGIPSSDLRREWENQREAQMSVRARESRIL
jgi:hypothetical protein